MSQKWPLTCWGSSNSSSFSDSSSSSFSTVSWFEGVLDKDKTARIVLKISSFTAISGGELVLLLVLGFCLNWFLKYPLGEEFSELVFFNPTTSLVNARIAFYNCSTSNSLSFSELGLSLFLWGKLSTFPLLFGS